MFSLTKDIQAFMLRVTASLDNLDDAVRDAQRLIRNADATVTEVRRTLDGIKAGLAGPQQPQDGA